jgi:TPR repeat protein
MARRCWCGGRFQLPQTTAKCISGSSSCGSRLLTVAVGRSLSSPTAAASLVPISVRAAARVNNPTTRLWALLSAPAAAINRQSRRGAIRSLSSSPAEGSPSGDALYLQYLETQQRLKDLLIEQERIKSEKMYQAWNAKRNDDDDEHRAKDISQGVAVVRTLAKESKKASAGGVTDPCTALQKEMEDLLVRAANANHPHAVVALGNYHLEEGKYHDALDIYKKAGEELNIPEGWFNYGHCLWTGLGDDSDRSSTTVIPADQERAMQAFYKAVEAGDIDSMYFVGVHMLGRNEGDNHDDNSNNTASPLDPSSLGELQTGLRYIQQAADAGHGGALHYLAVLHLNGHAALAIPACSPEDFVLRLDRAVEHDSSGDALFLRGSCYWHGDSGYELDHVKGLDDFLKAADLDHVDAAVSAGAVLHQGLGIVIDQDQRRAFQLYQHAGALGSVEGWRNVVACYMTGEGVPQSTTMAKYIAETMLGGSIDDVMMKKEDVSKEEGNDNTVVQP